MERVFLEISLEPLESECLQLESFNRCRDFLLEKYVTLSLPKDIENLDEEGKELLSSLYESDYEWSKKGPITFAKPKSLLCGRLEIELFSSETPKTCENFKCLIDGSKGLMKKAPKKPLHYLKSPFHRIVKNWIAQAGDITRFDGSGGESIYGGKFNDEKEGLKKSFERGSLAMANSGKNSNTSQFFICLSSAKEKTGKLLNGKYVVFGKVVSENFYVLDEIDKYGSESGEPTRKLYISDCGILL